MCIFSCKQASSPIWWRKVKNEAKSRSLLYSTTTWFLPSWSILLSLLLFEVDEINIFRSQKVRPVSKWSRSLDLERWMRIQMVKIAVAHTEDQISGRGSFTRWLVRSPSAWASWGLGKLWGLNQTLGLLPLHPLFGAWGEWAVCYTRCLGPHHLCGGKGEGYVILGFACDHKFDYHLQWLGVPTTCT